MGINASRSKADDDVHHIGVGVGTKCGEGKSNGAAPALLDRRSSDDAAPDRS